MNRLLFLLLFLPIMACNGQEHSTNATGHMENEHAHTNSLIDETSPYLLQHAHNPVNWYPWNDEALEKAKKEDKLLLISIGYSACHWCHVMERESFEDEEVAKIMNDLFVCIKVDREERPDVDQIYMDAVQLMNQRGGWPLNCFALPDGKPFFGGTYFPKSSWMDILKRVQQEYVNNRDKVEEYANKLTQGVQSVGLIPLNTEEPTFSAKLLDAAVANWEQTFDPREGGPNRAPKFPLPNSLEFLLRYAHHNDHEAVKYHVELTLDKMAYGGIYDQLGGGFARYSTDIEWKVPHFEKMLYDNGQLVSLYAEAYQATGKTDYKQVVYETIAFVDRELTDKTGAFYSALDADSEGEEGKFYIWKKPELKEILGDGFDLFADYYNVNGKGFWEHGNYILLRDKSDEEVAAKHRLSVADMQEQLAVSKKKLMEVRDTRIRPGLDDKSLTSWNGLMLKGCANAYAVFQEPKFLEMAEANAEFILKHQLKKDGSLWHSYKKGRSTINGYLEDYCFVIEGFIALYQVTMDEKWLKESERLADYAIAHFFNPANGMFFFTSDQDNPLVARKSEINDNVIPASNSSMAKGLFYLGLYLDRQDFLDKSAVMLNNVQESIPDYNQGHSNWGILMLHHLHPFYEVAISGKDAEERLADLSGHYLPNKLVLASEKESNLPLLVNKFVKGKTLIYVCLNKSCQLPVSEVADAIEQTKN